MRFLLFFLFSLIASAEIDNDAAVEMSAIELNYGVDVYECDQNLQKLDGENLQKKNKMGQVYRVCLRPNAVASNANVGIAQVNSWKWYMDDQVQPVVIDGQALGGIAQVQCQEGGKLCFLDSMLIASFYDNPGTVRGEGTVSFTSGTGSVEGTYDLFMLKFNLQFIGADGEKMSDEDVAELMKSVAEHNEAVEAAENVDKLSTDEL